MSDFQCNQSEILIIPPNSPKFNLKKTVINLLRNIKLYRVSALAMNFGTQP